MQRIECSMGSGFSVRITAWRASAGGRPGHRSALSAAWPKGSGLPHGAPAPAHPLGGRRSWLLVRGGRTRAHAAIMSVRVLFAFLQHHVANRACLPCTNMYRVHNHFCVCCPQMTLVASGLLLCMMLLLCSECFVM